MKTEQSSLIRIVDHLIKRLNDYASEDGLYQIIAEVMHDLAPQSVVLINSYDEISRLFQLRAVYHPGIDMRTVSLSMGMNPIGMSLPLGAEIRSILVQGKISRPDAGIYALGGGIIPLDICSDIMQRLNISGVYVIGFTCEGVLLGSACFILLSEEVSLDCEQINSLAGLISGFLYSRFSRLGEYSHS